MCDVHIIYAVGSSMLNVVTFHNDKYLNYIGQLYEVKVNTSSQGHNFIDTSASNYHTAVYELHINKNVQHSATVFK